MKKQMVILLFLSGLLCPVFIHAQAHLGAFETEIKDYHPNNVFKDGLTNTGDRFIYSDLELGTFYYYFDRTNYKTYECRQYPFNNENLNAQIGIYNKKYVVTSQSSWTAYLDGGAVMYIKLKYVDQYKVYCFYYKFTDD